MKGVGALVMAVSFTGILVKLSRTIVIYRKRYIQNIFSILCKATKYTEDLKYGDNQDHYDERKRKVKFFISG